MRIYFIIITSSFFIEILSILLFISLYKVNAIICSAALIFFNFSYFIREHRGLFEYYKIQEKLEIIGIMNFKILVLYLIKYTYLYWYFHYKDLQGLKKLISWDFNI